MTNRPCSYLLPKAILETSLAETVDGKIDIYQPVYSCHIPQLEWSGTGENVFWDNRFLSFRQRRHYLDHEFLDLWSYYIVEKKFQLLGHKSITLDKGNDQILFSSDCRFCLLFNLEMKRDCTCIHISCVTFKHRNGMDFEEFVYYKDVAILKYNHLFHTFKTVLSANDEHLVIITGFKLFPNERCSRYLDVLHCGISPNRVLITTKVRHKLDEHIGKQQIRKAISNHNGTSLFIVTEESGIILYVISQDLFSKLLTLPGSSVDLCVCSKFGNQLIFIDQSEHLFLISIDNKNLYIEKSFTLKKFNIHDLYLSKILLNCLEGIILAIFTPTMILIIDVQLDIVIARLMPSENMYICLMGWTGEEIAVINVRKYPNMDLFYVKHKNISLKHLSRLAVMQTYSQKALKEMNIPTALKMYMKLF